jgi:hypothetical protein
MAKKYLIVGLLLCSCVTEKVWHKDGSTQDQFGIDNYACMKDNSSYQASSTRYWASSGEGVNQDLYAACMHAKGYHAVDAP